MSTIKLLFVGLLVAWLGNSTGGAVVSLTANGAPGVAVAAVGTGGADNPAQAPPVNTCVSIPPLAFFVERIGGTRIAVEVVLPPGASPAAYDPTPQQMARLTEAQLFVGIGVPMERQLLPHVRRTLAAAAIVEAQAGIPLRKNPAAEVATGHEDPQVSAKAGVGNVGHHDHSGEFDPHVWLSPRLAVLIARNVCAGLTRNDPASAHVYQHNLEQLEAELAALDREIGQILAPVAGRDLIVFHPAFGYLAADYGLHQVAIEQGGLAPSPRHLAEILDRIRARGETAIFLQPQFSQASAQAVAEAAGVRLVVLDPLRRDYLANLREMARTIQQALTTE